MPAVLRAQLVSGAGNLRGSIAHALVRSLSLSSILISDWHVRLDLFHWHRLSSLNSNLLLLLRTTMHCNRLLIVSISFLVIVRHLVLNAW